MKFRPESTKVRLLGGYLHSAAGDVEYEVVSSSVSGEHTSGVSYIKSPDGMKHWVPWFALHEVSKTFTARVEGIDLTAIASSPKELEEVHSEVWNAINDVMRRHGGSVTTEGETSWRESRA